jgi:tetratricopeptide (TPR) repeat protein
LNHQQAVRIIAHGLFCLPRAIFRRMDGFDNGYVPMPENEPRITPRRRRLYRALALVVVPLVLLGALEGGLRLAGFGYSTRWVIRHGEGNAWIPNHAFTWPYLGPALGRAPFPFYMQDKQPDTCRVFVIGGSAAVGVPDPAFNFARALDVMCDAQLASPKIEIINTAITAVNSHVMLPVVRAAADHQPDVFLVYMGNNEVIGPFGAGTVATGFTRDRKVIRLLVTMRSMRIGQAIEAAMRAAGAGNRAQRWQQIAMFINHHVAADDPKLQGVYDHFRANLVDICRAGRAAGADVVLCTVAVNLRDCPPFASLHTAGLSDGQLARWQAAFDRGVAAQAAGDHTDALATFADAAEYDDAYAELAFRMGQCAEAMGDIDAAAEHYQRACDLDGLRIRADSTINRIIREVAAAEGATLIDVEKQLRRSHPLPGDDLFYEHVHFTFEGNYEVADAIVEPLQAVMASRFAHVARNDAPLPGVDECGEALGLSDLYRMDMAVAMSAMMDEPPFTFQFDFEERSRRRHEALRMRERQLPERQTIDSAYRTVVRALGERPEDLAIMMHTIDLISRRGETHKAVAMYEQLIQVIPNASPMRCSLVRLLIELGEYDRAMQQLRTAGRLDPGDPWIFFAIGNVLEHRGRMNDAIDQYRSVIRRFPDWPEALSRTALLLSCYDDASLRDGAAALEYAEHLVDVTGGKQGAALAVLASARAEVGDFAGAQAACEQAIKQAAPGDPIDQWQRHMAMYRAGQPRRIRASE